MHNNTVLIIDDDPFMHQAIAKTLRSCDAKLIFASSGQEAIETIERVEVAVIICDQRMPGMSGFETLARLRQIQPDAYRVMLTGETDLTTAINAVNEGKVSKYLLKPWNNLELQETVRVALEDFEKIQNNLLDKKKNISQRRDLRAWSQMLEGVVTTRTNELFYAYDETLNALVMALDAREQATAGHSRRVAILTLYTALLMQLEHELLENIYRGALLHDFGKIGITDAILLKPGKLEPDERLIIEQHVEIGEKLIEGIGYLAAARPLIRSHHEKFDGTGYPDGLRGEDIPVGARIFALVDVYDALRSERPYKRAMSHADAAEIIRESSGSHFDPEIAECFLGISEESISYLFHEAMETDSFGKAMTLCGRRVYLDRNADDTTTASIQNEAA